MPNSAELLIYLLLQKEVQEDDIDKSHWGELESESESEEESSEESEAEADETGLVTPAEGYVIAVCFDANHSSQLMREYLHFQYTIPVLNKHSKIDKTKVLTTIGSLMKVESIAECSLEAFCNTFDLR